MPRNVDLIQGQFGSKNPLPSIELADNALKLGGVPANMYVLKKHLSEQAGLLLENIEEVLNALNEHERDDVKHLSEGQIKTISEAINATKALEIANKAIANAQAGIQSGAVQTTVCFSLLASTVFGTNSCIFSPQQTTGTLLSTTFTTTLPQ